MLPIQSILNHGTTRTRSPFSQQSGSELSSPSSDLNDSMIPGLDQQPFPRKKKSRDSSDLTYTRPQGVIKYPPFEDLDREAYSQIQSFGIYPFGEIGQYCAHIPYSSDKKDVFEKTGRESFHVFVYKFTDPSDSRAYDVMWDYVGGFVRISPFFKSRGHKKTGPAKMLDLNKGLRDVTFHMTGGNRVAQGYWVPYQCARAVCATFCYPIAGALIPIFGPTFPDDCIRPGTALFGRMVIDERLIREASHEITAYRHSSLSLTKRPTSYPRQGYQPTEHSRQKSEQDLIINPFLGADSRKHRTSESIQHSRSASGGMPWPDQYGTGFGPPLTDENHLPSINSEPEPDLPTHPNTLFTPVRQPKIDQISALPTTQKRGRTENETRYWLRYPESQERPKRPRLEAEADIQSRVPTAPRINVQNAVPALPSHTPLGCSLESRPCDQIQLDPRLIQTQPDPRHTITLDGRNYSYEEMEAAAVLMNIGNYCRNQALGSNPIEPRPRYGSV
ncbi:unnamed protein product [Clonostachys rhizophaga]|uniref:HTH APSES-type domain-containing protein n=1 Tax=Clonostachys rhizophaga TaxID=160324 RepID=A0A9N9V3R6_9HYPO|nr:unnamed protein product [Clonostachys rhizophaga]